MIIRDPGLGGELPIEPQSSDGAIGKGVYDASATGSEGGASDRQPKGDHNRRLALDMDIDDFAREAGVTADELRGYESTGPDHVFDLAVAARVGATLDRLEAKPPSTQKVSNGPVT